ncbi:MAG: sulfatase-like hydrolase/transferase [Planctomycetaceae bacterium]|nr:sulfatase-like hydrolase/transferase [Planctomycetales bacterium]MCB9940472.1 sulfatase-like hydrolase/transferase [Planctomycetaceae bacterium]
MKSFLALFAVLFTFAASQAQHNLGHPNILLIMADDVGVDVLGCYGGESYKTPRLDALAAGGMRFEHCYSMPVCHPTRITLMTGRYPFRTGNPKWGSFPVEEERNTFAHVLKNAGYATAVAGKWQICMMKNDLDHAQRLGFDESCLFGWHEGPRYYSPMIYQNGKLREGLEDRYGPDVYVEFLIDFIERNQRKPFFAYYPMALCHDVTDDLKDPVPFGPHGHYDTYKEMAEAMDVRVGRLIDALERLGLRENTLILFTTDNGTPVSYIHSAEPNPDPKGKDTYIRIPVVSKRNGKDVPGGKGSLTNGGTNVPLIANWPGKIKASQVADDLVDFSDFLPTLAEFAKAYLPAGVKLDGTSFASRLVDGQPSPQTWAFAEHGKKYWVRDQRWKLYDDGTLFDVERDPREKSPVKELSTEAARAREKLTAVTRSLDYK